MFSLSCSMYYRAFEELLDILAFMNIIGTSISYRAIMFDDLLPNYSINFLHFLEMEVVLGVLGCCYIVNHILII